MAVYTALDDGKLAPWLAAHRVGSLVACRGIPSGIENSNFFVTTRGDDGLTAEYVLTLFERLSLDALPFYLSLMQHLAQAGVPCPAPVPDVDGRLCSRLAGKPAALVTRLPGRSIDAPTPGHCTAMGRALAAMHRAGADFAGGQPNPRGIDWWVAAAARVRPFLDDGQRALLDGELAHVTASWTASTGTLPRGPIHADVFRDNVLFVDEGEDAMPGVAGIIDFYFAGVDPWILDVAICLNDWCVDLASGAFDAPRLAAFVRAYDAARPLEAAERTVLPTMLRAAALRFWLSRLDDFHRPRPAQLLTPHDPTHFERILRHRRDDAAAGRARFDGTD